MGGLIGGKKEIKIDPNASHDERTVQTSAVVSLRGNYNNNTDTLAGTLANISFDTSC